MVLKILLLWIGFQEKIHIGMSEEKRHFPILSGAGIVSNSKVLCEKLTHESQKAVRQPPLWLLCFIWINLLVLK